MLTVENLTRGQPPQNGKPSLTIEDDRVSMISTSTVITNRSRRCSGSGAEHWSNLRKRLSIISNKGFSNYSHLNPPPPSISFGSVVGSTTKQQQQQPRVQNTYKMTPDENEFFPPIRVEKAVKATMERVLQDAVYEPENGGHLTEVLTEAVKAKVKALCHKRLKIVVQVVIWSRSGQSMEIASRCLWDADTDNFASVCYENESIFAVANIFAVYFE